MANEQNLIPAKKGEVRNPAGRPKKFTGQVLAEMSKKGYQRVTKEEVTGAYELLINIPEKELREIVEDKEKSMLLRVVGKAILSSKGFEIIEKMLDRAHGKVDAGGVNNNVFIGIQEIRERYK